MTEHIDIYDGKIRLDAELARPEETGEEGTLTSSSEASEPAGSPRPSGGRSGEKLPLCIIIHGLTGDKDDALPQAIERVVLSLGMASLRVDMFGHGKSDGTFFDHTLSKWFLNLLAIVDYAEKLDFVDGIYLCGHSQGGLTVMMGAAMLRDRIRGLIPIAPAWVIPDQVREGTLLGHRFDGEKIPEELPLPDYELTLGGHYLREAQLIFVKEAVSRYDGPVLIVHGTEDELVPYHFSEEIQSCYRDVKLVPIPGDTHCFDYHVDQAAEVVKEWLGDDRTHRYL